MLQWLHDAGYELDPDCAYSAAWSGHTHVLAWLLSLDLRIDLPNNCHAWPVPALMLWGHHRAPLGPALQAQLKRARATFCTFHGLIRWSREHHSASSRVSLQDPWPFCSQSSSGQRLLVNLARLPHDIVSKIAVAADLQYDPALGGFNSGVV